MSNSFSSGAILGGKAVSRPADNLLRQCSQWNRHESSPRLASCRGAYVQPQPRKKVARVYKNRRDYTPVSLGSEKSVESRKIAPPCGAVVEYVLGGPALSTDTVSSCSCLSPSA